MFNVLLDPLPTEYKGFPIDSDFQIGIQIFQAFENDDLTEQEKFATAFDLLFMDSDENGNPIPHKDENGNDLPLPDIVTAKEGIEWFLGGWYTDNTVDDGGEKHKDMDYDIDQWRIYSAFLKQYRIDLNTDKVHFWKFMGLLSTVDECAYTRIIDIRTQKIKPKMEAEYKNAIKKAKQKYSLQSYDDELTAEDQEAIDAFMEFVKRK